MIFAYGDRVEPAILPEGEMKAEGPVEHLRNALQIVNGLS